MNTGLFQNVRDGIVCRKCGELGNVRLSPHYLHTGGRVDCAGCGKFIKWLKAETPWAQEQ